MSTSAYITLIGLWSPILPEAPELACEECREDWDSACCLGVLMEIRPLRHLAWSLVPSSCSVNLGCSSNTWPNSLTLLPFKSAIFASEKGSCPPPLHL